MSERLSNKPTSFGDDVVFDANSPSNIEYKVDPNPLPSSPPLISPSTSVDYVEETPMRIIPQGITNTSAVIVGPSCYMYEPPWPTIIISVLGAIVVIYTAIAPNVDENRRVFGVILMLLWTAVWAIILWVLWRECHRSASWWLLLIPVILMAIFFVVIIILNLGSSI